MIDRRAARPYARAAFALAKESGKEESLELQLKLLATLWEESQPLRRFLLHPQIERPAKLDALHRLLGDRLDDLGRRFVDVVLDKGRVTLLPTIHAEFRRLWDDERGIVQAEVQSAVELTAGEREKLSQTLGRITGKTVEMTVHVNPSLLGGVVVRVGDRILDGSLASQLARLGERLHSSSGGGYAFEH